VTVRVPPGTPSGRTLRVRGKGVATRAGHTGDLLVTVDVQVPTEINETTREALEKITGSLNGDDVRGDLLRMAREE
jgi:molecular chaperone DnaJ